MAINLTELDNQGLKRIADSFARAFQSSAGGSSSSSRKGPDPEEIAEREEEHLRAVTESSKSLKELAKNAGGFLAKLGGMFDGVSAAQKGLEDARANLATGLDAGTKGVQQFSEIMLGTRIKELAEINQQSRLVSISMGGLETWTSKLMSRHEEYYKQIGDNVKTTKFMADMMDNFSNSGLKPSLELYEQSAGGIGKFGQSIQTSMNNLYKMGVGMEESQKILRDATEDEDIRNRLRGAASNKERQMILQGYMARIQEFKQMGMTTEQATKAAKALERLSGKGPLERYKMAAKAQASLSAMGIEGADVMAQFIRAGDTASDELRSQAAQVGANAQDYLASSRAAGGAQEFFASIMADKGGLMDIIGKGGVFSTKLTEEVKVTNTQLEKLVTMAQSSSMDDELIKKTAYWGGIVGDAIDNSMIGKLIAPALNAILDSPAINAALGVGMAGLATGGLATGLMAEMDKRGFDTSYAKRAIDPKGFEKERLINPEKLRGWGYDPRSEKEKAKAGKFYEHKLQRDQLAQSAGREAKNLRDILNEAKKNNDPQKVKEVTEAINNLNKSYDAQMLALKQRQAQEANAGKSHGDALQTIASNGTELNKMIKDGKGITVNHNFQEARADAE